MRPLTIPNLPAAAGLTARYFADASDYGRIVAAMCDAHAHDGIPWLPTEENIRTE